jgi:citrate synthase
MTQIIDGEEYLDGDEAAALLGVKKATLYAYVSRGTLKSYKQRVGRSKLYRRAELAALLVVKPSAEPEADRVLRDVELPDAASWASEH